MVRVSDLAVTEALQAALDSLPDTPEGIADMLIAAGIRGEPQCATLCPLAVWMTSTVGSEVAIWENGDGGFDVGTVEHANPWRYTNRLPLSDIGCIFVKLFDSDEPWPELVAE